MAGDPDLTADLACLIQNANRRLFERDVQSRIVLHAASPTDVRDPSTGPRSYQPEALHLTAEWQGRPQAEYPI